MPKQHPNMAEKLSDMGPNWGHAGFQNPFERVQERKKTTPKTGQELSSKIIPSGNRSGATARSGAESKWPPQGAGGLLS